MVELQTASVAASLGLPDRRRTVEAILRRKRRKRGSFLPALPGAPLNPDGDAQGGGIFEFRWDPPVGGADGFEVERKLAAEPVSAYVLGARVGPLATWAWVTGMAPGSYIFRARSYNLAGYSAYVTLGPLAVN